MKGGSRGFFRARSTGHTRAGRAPGARATSGDPRAGTSRPWRRPSTPRSWIAAPTVRRRRRPSRSRRAPPHHQPPSRSACGRRIGPGYLVAQGSGEAQHARVPPGHRVSRRGHSRLGASSAFHSLRAHRAAGGSPPRRPPVPAAGPEQGRVAGLEKVPASRQRVVREAARVELRRALAMPVAALARAVVRVQLMSRAQPVADHTPCR